MRIPTGVTDQGFYFVAVDPVDLFTREPGLSGFTVTRARNNGAAATMTTPTITEVSAGLQPGVYFLLCDEDMTLDSGDDSQAMAYHITHASMAPLTREIEIYRPVPVALAALIGTPVASLATDIAGVQADTDNIQTRLPAALMSGRMNSDVGALQSGVITATSIVDGAFTAAKFAAGAFDAVWTVATRLLTAGTNIVLAKGVGVTGFNDVSTAQVNAEVVDALATDTYAEPGQGTPNATLSIAGKVGYMFKAWRNRHTQTDTEYALYADDAVTKDQKAVTSDDDITFERGEIQSGP
jgi:hypothetical protein